MEGNNKMIRALYFVFVLSGFCGLIYESIWSHYLKLFLGHAIYGQVTVLVVFIGGMSVGAWLIGKFETRIKNPLLMYALVELIIGVISLFFHDIYKAVIDFSYVSILPAYCSDAGLCWSQVLIAALIILPQSLLLGTTFPLMSSSVLKISPESAGEKISSLYFANSIGAVFGVLASVFVFIPSVGLPGALLISALGNLLIAVILYIASKKVVYQEHQAQQETEERYKGSAVKILFILSAVTGMASFIYEIVWIRMLSLVTGASTHSFELMLSSFILGLACGGLWIKSRIDRFKEPIYTLAQVQIFMGVCALLTFPVYNLCFGLMESVISGLAQTNEGYVIYNVVSKLLYLLVMFPTTFLAGMTLPLVTKVLLKSELKRKAVGYVYSVNTLGSILGVLMAVYLLMPLIGLKGALFFGAFLDITLGAALIFMLIRKNRSNFSFGSVYAAAACLVAIYVTVDVDQRQLASGVFRHGNAELDKDFDVVFARDGRTSTVHLIKNEDGILGLLTNGKSDGAINVKEGGLQAADEETMTLLSALPLAYKPDAKTAAQIGFGTGLGSATMLASDALVSLDTVEIEPVMYEAAKQFMPINQAAYDDPRHNVIFDDAKSYFAKNAHQYDIIVAEPSNPWVSGVSSLFTREFYKHMKSKLTEDGIFTQWIQLYEIEPQLVASVLNALAENFEHYHLYLSAEADMIVIASNSNQLAPQQSLFEMKRVSDLLARIDIYSLNDLKVRYIADNLLIKELNKSATDKANSDYYPILDVYSSRARFKKSSAIDVLELAQRDFAAGYLLNEHGSTSPSQKALLKSDNFFTKQYRTALEIEQFLLGVAHFDEFKEQEDWYKDADNFKRVLVSCEITDSVQLSLLWDDVHSTAATVNGFLPSGQRAHFWQRIKDNGCARVLPTRYSHLLDTYYSLAVKDWDSAKHQLSLLKAEPFESGLLNSFVLKSLMAVHVVSGNNHQAQELQSELKEKLGEGEKTNVWYRILSEMSLSEGSTLAASSMPNGRIR
ncbi:fused MFS/spermidine synthase [Pleionea sp. CnH1-48]|uniref:fused MFS/spermidine synthase n=1 Tax=Pleionea sp. CnH1-48 TaxID=2954494 RepID=UPI0020983113|nr:fused MFS/spermidine synthase [Pleionea sp. CnH1-48]MCO7223826.1 fused MFS/spermidine synthase [Pleionea sp. CnH1-48]